MLNSDSAMQRKFDRALIRQGINLLPGVRRFISAAHGEAEIEATVRAVDAVCRELA
jgi:glutamate-1-semialdehyde aminotransferase